MGIRSFDYMGQFWRENEMQTFSARETQLYFFLLAECKRRYWQASFGCSTQRITNNLGISRQTLCRLRKKLQDRGLIAYEEGKNNSSIPGYTLLIKVDTNKTVQRNMTANGTLDGTAAGTIINSIDKINKSIIPKQVQNGNLSSIVESAKGKEYRCREVIYVDSDIKEIFSLLKAKMKIPISPLVSYILEEWLQEHAEDIQEAIKVNKNRFLE